MSKRPLSEAEKEKLRAQLYRDVAARQSGYRERALAIHPHVCARCGRAFEGKRLKELTVHHRDHNHHNNPPDGSNWELLCLYCHDHEHDKGSIAGYFDASSLAEDEKPKPMANPFAALDAMMLTKKPKEDGRAG